MNRMKILHILLGALLVAGVAVARETNTAGRSFSSPAVFSKIVQSNGTIVVTSPTTQVRFLAFMNSTNVGFAVAGRQFTLGSGDVLDLVEKHTTFKAKAVITKTETELTVTTVHDARSFGYSVTTNVVVLKENRK